ncbi:MAG: folate-binding protein YgfZ [Rhodospirillaceae bacterium]|jgi:tRNA-modifying protein YgfZ|nr:folate-binding protein YgfZ [Rhodospirillaceae bacterium]MBT4488706.1 folate-binding protein YgfZ [Rhodospirillaceae bacterium]MBT5195227.1 folate-binding protein YgfZ [Rhodospirillaceae bacterium]MBT5897684.1 folate-binding protein YgfZ [Rhodospirillaceae bacterium]MBT6427806.1 folate-binding protein YgfZ [Rhodospirillaceae bacterium]
MEANYCLLPGRDVLRLSGADVRTFLQALVTRDLDHLSPKNAVYGALLTPQGKYLFDFFIAQQDDDLLLDVEAARRDELVKRLNMYRLRADVTIERADNWQVHAVFDGDIGLEQAVGAARAFGDGVAFVDPRLAAAGARIMAPAGQADEILGATGLIAGEAADYDYVRLNLALPDSGRDLVVDKSLMLESNLDALHGVDFDKGCFVGQELTARTKYRALVRKRLLPVTIDGPVPVPNAPLMAGDKEIASMRSGQGDRGLALVRLDRLAEAGGLGLSLTADGTTVTPAMPDWAEFPLQESE